MWVGFLPFQFPILAPHSLWSLPRQPPLAFLSLLQSRSPPPLLALRASLKLMTSLVAPLSARPECLTRSLPLACLTPWAAWANGPCP